MPHKLDPLLLPRSIAVVGASQRKEAVGNMVLKNLQEGGYPGKLYAVNPGYSEIGKIACFPALSDIPETVEHVIFAISDERIEEALDAAIEHGIKAGTILSSLVLANDTSPTLKERIYEKARLADILLCGGNSMGFYNFTDSIWACGFDTRSHRKPGNVTLISQSGSGMSGILDVDERIDFNFAVSTGQELLVTAEDYLDYALDQKETRVIGFFMETSRCPEKLVAVFVKARQREIPIVVVKVGRTALASKLAESHSGAMAGIDAVYDAVFDYYGVQRVDDMDELATTLIMFAQPHKPAEGGVVSIHDSGGERQLLIDLADKYDVDLTSLTAKTVGQLEKLLDPGLPAVNPLDAWSLGGPGYHQTMTDCFVALLNDPGAALGAVVHDRAPFGRIYDDYIDYLRKGHSASGKPVFLVSARQGTGEDGKVIESTREGFPVLDGVSQFLMGAKCLMAHRDFLARPVMELPVLAEDSLTCWRERFSEITEISEHQASVFLSDFGIPMVKSKLVDSKKELLISASAINYPVVLKTAKQGIKHKTEIDGVVLDIEDEVALQAAYDELSSRIGSEVLIEGMVTEPGMEMILGIARDEQFGPMIIMGIGGVYTESLKDIVLVAPPFDRHYALACLEKLRMRKILDAVRAGPAWDLFAYCDAASRLSVLALAFEDQISELDINPIKIMEHACIGLDALLVLKTGVTEASNQESNIAYA